MCQVDPLPIHLSLPGSSDLCLLRLPQLPLEGGRGLLEPVEDGARLGVHHGVGGGGDGAARGRGDLVLPHDLEGVRVPVVDLLAHLGRGRCS